MTRKRRPRRAPAGVEAEVAMEEVGVDILDDSNGSSVEEPTGELVELASGVIDKEETEAAESTEVTEEIEAGARATVEAIPAGAVEQLLADEVSPETAADAMVEDVVEPVLVEAEDLSLVQEPARDEAGEEPWLELEEVPLPPRGEAALEAVSEVMAPALEAEAAELAPPALEAAKAAPERGSERARSQPRGFFGWLVGAVILGAAIGAIAALLVLSGINGGLSYTSSVSGVTLAQEQNRLASEIAALTQDMADVQSQLASLSDLASRVDIMSTDVETLRTGLTTANRGLEEISVGLGSLSSDLTTLGDDVTGISDQVTELAKGAEALQATALALETDVSTLDGQVVELGTGLGELSTGLGELSTDLDGVSAEVEELGVARAKFDSFLDGLRTLLASTTAE